MQNIFSVPKQLFRRECISHSLKTFHFSLYSTSLGQFYYHLNSSHQHSKTSCTVSVSTGCCNQNAQPPWIKKHTFISHSLGGRKSRVGVSTTEGFWRGHTWSFKLSSWHKLEQSLRGRFPRSASPVACLWGDCHDYRTWWQHGQQHSLGLAPGLYKQEGMGIHHIGINSLCVVLGHGYNVTDASNSCHLNFPEMDGCALALWAR